MKKAFFLIFFALSFFTLEAQKVYRTFETKYGKGDPVFSPRENENHQWFNTTNSKFSLYNRTEAAWEHVSTKADYAEMSISNDTSTISFAATTPAVLQDLTAGPISGFTMISDSLLRYDGLETAVFSVSYSSSISFAEAAGLINMYVEVNGTENKRTHVRQSTTLTTEKESISNSALISLSPGALVRVMVVPATHTGTDIFTAFEFNLNLREVN